jgi:hypothetical protein
MATLEEEQVWAFKSCTVQYAIKCKTPHCDFMLSFRRQTGLNIWKLVTLTKKHSCQITIMRKNNHSFQVVALAHPALAGFTSAGPGARGAAKSLLTHR